jgi:hypothetical protein
MLGLPDADDEEKDILERELEKEMGRLDDDWPAVGEAPDI